MSDPVSTPESHKNATSVSPKTQLRPWGKYGFVSSILMAIFMIACLSSFFLTLSFERESPAYVAGFFYMAAGFSIGAVVFSGMGLITNRNKIFAILGLVISGFVIGVVLLIRSMLGAS